MKLHWRGVPDHCARGDTVWAGPGGGAPVEVAWDRARMEALFRVEERPRRRSQLEARPRHLTVLDSKRSNQINIGIKNLPSLEKLRRVIEEMNDRGITREGIEKLQGLIPTEEEITSIKEAQKENSDLPLGTAEQFLMILNSINGLDCKLKLWAFKVDFKAMEKDICEPLRSLKVGIKNVKNCDMFSKLLRLILEVGNFLNSSQVPGFQLDFLSKITWVKDTATKKPLLYHILKVK